MLLVFARASASALTQVLRACKADPRIAALLRETFQGVIVDPAREPEVHALYGSLETTSLLESALPQVEVVKSPAYMRLLDGTDLLDELLGKEERAEAAHLVRLFERYEKGSPAATECRARATALDLDVGLSIITTQDGSVIARKWFARPARIDIGASAVPWKPGPRGIDGRQDARS